MNVFDQLPTLEDVDKPLAPGKAFTDYVGLPSIDFGKPPDLEALKARTTKPVKPLKLAGVSAVPKEEKPKKEPIGNPIGNFGRDIADIAGGIASLFTTGLWKGLKQLATEPSQHWEDLKTIYGEDGRAAIVDSMIGRYVKAIREDGAQGFGEEILRHPGLFLMDASALATGVGALAKGAGTAGRVAAYAGRAGGPLTQAASRAANVAARVSRAGQAISKTGQIVDPLMNAGKLAGKVGRPVLEALGVGPESPTLSALKDIELSDEMLKKVQSLRRIVDTGLSGAEKKLLDNAISVGNDADFMALRQSPRLQKAYNLWTELGGAQEKALADRPGVLSRTRADKANAKRAAIYLSERTGQKVSVEAALEMMKRGEIKPTFASMFKELEGETGIFNSFLDDLREGFGGTARKVARLEERSSSDNFVRDPSVYMARQTAMFHDLNWRLRWMDRVVHHLKGKNLIKAVRGPKDVPAGWEVIPETIYRRYYDTTARAGSVIVNEIQRQLATVGKATPDSIAASLGSFIEGEVAKGIGRVNTIAVPRHVARHIAREFGIPGPWGRIYDRSLGVWKSLATVLNPKYWVPVAVSNAFLGVLRGLGVRDFRNWAKFRELVPSAIRARSEVGLELHGASRFERVSGNAGEYAQMLDRELLRGPIYAQDAINTFKELKAAGDAFFSAKTSADDFLRNVSLSTDQLSGIERKVQLLQEQIAAQIPELVKMRKQAAALDRLIPRLQKAFAHATETHKTNPRRSNLIEIRRRLVAARESSGRLGLKISNEEARIVQKLQETGKLQQAIPELQQYAAVSEHALVEGNRWTGNYNRLHPIARVSFRRGVPFYNFLSAMLKLAFRMPYLYPARTFMWHRLAQMVNDAVTDDDQPEWVQRFVPFAASEDGGMWAFNLASANPFMGAKMTQLGEGDVPGILDITQQNPIVKLWMDLSGGIPRWSKRPISPGERATRLDSGQAVQIGADGVLRKTIPQLGLWRAVWNLNPMSQLFDQLLLGQAQSDRGWLLEPDPILDRAGQPLAQKTLTERLAPLFVRVQRIDLEAEKLKERRRIASVLRSFKDDIRRLPPEKRQDLMEVIRDRIQDDARRWEAVQD